VTRRTLLASLAASLLALAVAIAAGAARAASTQGSKLEVSIIHATQTDGGRSIDPALKDLPQLTRDQPFVRYNVYKLLDRKLFPLEANKPISFPLPNGRVLQVTLGGVTVEKNEKRYQLEAQIAEPGKAAFLKSLQVTTSENEPFFVGGQSYNGGVMFLELLVKP
jgi:hypothetical protein